MLEDCKRSLKLEQGNKLVIIRIVFSNSDDTQNQKRSEDHIQAQYKRHPSSTSINELLPI